MRDEKAAPREPARGKSGLARWEWLPLGVLVVLVLVYSFTEPGGGVHRFAFWVGLGLVPGVCLRLAGKPSWNVHRIFFAVSLMAFVLENPGLRPDAETLDRVAENWHLVVLGFAVSFTQSLWGALRTHRLLIDSGVAISLWGTLKLCLIGSFFNVFLPGSTGGDAYRIYGIAREYGGKLSHAIATISLDRFLGLPSLILVVLLGMAMDYRFFLANRLLSGLVPFIAAAGAVCLVFVIYLALAGFHRRRGHGSGRQAAAGGKPHGWLKRVHRMIATNVKRPLTLPLALLYGFFSHLACIVSCLCFGLALNVQGVPPLRYFLIVPMAMTINAIPGAPGGVGQGELAMATLLTMASPGEANAQAGVMVMLLFRLSNLVLGLVGGVLYAAGKAGGKGLQPVPADFEPVLAAERRDGGEND